MYKKENQICKVCANSKVDLLRYNFNQGEGEIKRGRREDEREGKRYNVLGKVV